MKIDNLFTRALVAEMQYLHEGARIEKIHQPTQYEVVLHLRTKQGNKKLLLSIHPETFRFHMTQRTIENPMQPKQFCLVLRKHLEGGKITEIAQLNHDRHIKITVETYNAVGDEVVRYLYLEMMGRHSNLIVTDEQNMIFDVLKRVDTSMNEYRELLPRLPYVVPPAAQRTEEQGLYYVQPFFKKWLEQHDYKPEVLAMYALEPKGYYYRAIDGKAEFISFMDVTDSLDVDNFEIIQRDTLSEVLDIYFSDRLQKQQLQEKVTSLIQFVHKHLQKNQKKIKNLQKDLAAAQGYEKYQQYGNLLLAQQHQLADNYDSAEVVDYFSPDQAVVRIPLDKKYGIAENAKRYFKRYTKSKTALIKVQEQLDLTVSEITYFETIQVALEQADLAAAEEIREELIRGGYIKRRRKDPLKPKVAKYQTFIIGDTKILVGKNNLQNDQVTMKERRKDYGWLHVKDFPGSHVLICTKHPSEELQYAGALLAAYYSKMRASENVAVDFTLVQNVTKPTGAKPGFVIYKHQTTLFVTPTRTIMDEIFPNHTF